MVNAFSEYARTPQMEPRPLALNTLLTEIIDLYRSQEGLNLICEFSPELPLIQADSGRIRQILHNLLKNSLEALANTPAPQIKLSTALITDKNNHVVELRIEDNGPGIPEKIIDRVFEPYITTKSRGTGLGLAIVKRIIEEHGGKITANNPDHGGTVMVIHLPVLAKD